MPTLLERGIPIDAINDYSSAEKGPGRPPHWEMVFWWTRKPLAGARAIIAASLLPDNAYQNMGQFLNDLFPCINEKRTAHSCNPSPRLIEKLRGKKLLDPFAGFGSIPLEASRLDVDAVAVELLPTAYVFLKAVLEYPRLFSDRFVEVDGKTVKELGLENVAKQFSGRREVSESGRYRVPMLIYDVARWGSWVINKLREDPVIRELYDADVYIGTWEVKCPVCGRYTPLVGNWWLARVKSSNRGFERLAWMEWRNSEIKVVDLNEQCRQQRLGNCDNLSAEVTIRGEEGGSVRWANQKFVVPTKNVNARGETAQCLYCRAEINHRVVNGKVVKGGKKDGDWYVKWALRRWNENYEKYLRGEITLDELRQSPARPTLLVKVYVKDGDLQFKPATQQDTEKLWKAAEELRKMWGDPDIPTEQISVYETKRITPILGANRWYQFFNPRQLLTLIKLVKLIRQVGHVAEEKIKEEKLKEGWNSEDARKYAEAVITYLAIALARFVDHNNSATLLHPSNPMGIEIAHALSMRGIAMQWNWGDTNPFVITRGLLRTNSFSKCLEKEIEALAYLVSAVSGSSSSVRVLLDDATELSKLEGEKFDVIVTDPPYADDVPYSELSDFYYVWLKRALSDVENNELKPRFLSEAFFDEDLEILTQWHRFAPKEVSENEGRWEHFSLKVTFAELLTRAFANVLRFLKDDGLLVVYYVAKRPEAWAALVDALWRENGLELVAAYPVETESEENVVARGKASVLGGYVSAWRRRVGEKPLDLDVEREEAVREVASRLGDRLKALRSTKGSATMWVYSYLAALEYLTAHYPVRLGGVELGSDGLMRQAVVLAFEALLRSSGIKLTDRGAHAYLALRIMESEGGRVDSDTLSYVEKAVGLEHKDLVRLGLITEVETGGPNVAKRKTFEVLAPRNDTVDEVKRVYSLQRGRSAVLDCLRQLQLNATTRIRTLITCTSEVREEALNLARALIELSKLGLLDKDDADVKLSKLILGMEWWQ